jgi:hypothetical protein
MNRHPPTTTAALVFVTLVATLPMACEENKGIDLPGEEIDCLWFEGDNCWRESLATLTPLLPESGTTGVLAADGKSCTYENGVRFTFVNPLDPARLGEETYLNDFLWDFEGRLDGDFFMAYREPEATSVVLQTSQGSYTQLVDSGALGISCPNGDLFRVTVAALLAGCEKTSLPGRKTFWDENGVVFALKGNGVNDLLVFHCEVE